MKILFAFPRWDNRWLPYFKNEMAKYDTRYIATDDLSLNMLWSESIKADVLINMWSDDVTQFWAEFFDDKPIISYFRRYERYVEKWMDRTKWKNVDALVFVSEFVQEMFLSMVKERHPKKTYVIPNAIDLNQFPFKERDGELTNIALVCRVAPAKGVALAAQILMLLPEKYTMHHIGGIMPQDLSMWKDYLHYMGLSKRWVWHPKVPSKNIPLWFQDKDFILSTSLMEGNPNNILEGMACGCIPVVHNWPGADKQFHKSYIFNTVKRAAEIIQDTNLHNRKYQRVWVNKFYSLENIKKIHDVIREVTGG